MKPPVPTINIRRAADGSWTAHPQPPLAAISTHVADGWAGIVALREAFGAIEHFETEDYHRFVSEFGGPPTVVEGVPTD